MSVSASCIACLLTLAPAAQQEPVAAAAVDAPLVPREDDREFDGTSWIELDSLTEEQVANLALLTKVWGFLKYHHPRITAGEVHWDYELFRVMPSVLDAPDRATTAAALVDWAARLGPLGACDPCAAPPPPERVYLPAELDWTRDRERLGDDLAGLLADVYRNRHAGGDQFYVSKHPSVGHPNFDNEEAYPELVELDAGYRLLAFMRYWNIIEYWFPYKDVIGRPWDEALHAYLPRFAEANGADELALVSMSLIASVYDTHANLWNRLHLRPPVGPGVLPVVLRFVDGQAVVTGYSGSAGPGIGLVPGDAILAIDGRTVQSLVEEWSPLYAASNEDTRMRDIARSLTRGPLGPVALRVETGDGVSELQLERVDPSGFEEPPRRWHDHAGPTFRLLSDDVGYLTLSSITRGAVAEHIAAAQGTRGLVIDIRNYPGQFVVLTLGGHLVEEPTPFAKFTTGALDNPGAFTWTEPVVLHPKQPHYDGRVVILIDEVSQSQAEYTAMALRTAPDAVVIGSTTAGADGNVSSIRLPGGLSTMISGIGVFYPNGRPTQRVGIRPDIRLRPTREGIRAGRDELLEEALRQILGDEVPADEIERMARW